MPALPPKAIAPATATIEVLSSAVMLRLDPVTAPPRTLASVSVSIVLTATEPATPYPFLTELGTARLVPLVTERGVAEATDAARERLKRGVIEACKQCGRNTLMEIAEPATLGDLAARHPAAVRLIAHPGCGPLTEKSLTTAGQPIAEIVAAVGPEGGFTPEEIDFAATAGFCQVSLGGHILRIETAAIALAVWASLATTSR